MKDMDTYGNIAFCTLLLYCSSTITASSSAHSFITRRDREVSDVNSRNQTQSFINSTENTSHTHTTAGMVVFNSSDAGEHHLNVSVKSSDAASLPSTSPISITPADDESTRTTAHEDTPSALYARDDVLDIYPRVSSDPPLAGLLSACVVIAALASVLVFLKFRHRNDGAEFSRLQDLPMDDMLEDAPLSTYSY